MCRWDGIAIELFHDDHPPPHFHAQYAEFEALIAIKTLDVLASDLPRRVLADVLAWARTRQAELLEDWDLCQANLLPLRITPPR